MRRIAWLLPLLLAGGCVYYNGMYNTKTLAGRARQAEREGRTFDASNLWGQVSVKAESLLARHPRSKYAEEARLLHGTARARLNDCSGALPDLEQVMLTSPKPAFAEDAAELVGSCRVLLGDPASAATIYGRLTGSTNPERRDLALFAHGQALRLNGQYDAAFSELRQSRHPRARGERAAALAAAGKVDEATAVVDSLVTARDSLAPWPDIVRGLGEHDPAEGTALTERLVAAPFLSASVRGRLLIDDGLRLSAADPARGDARLEQAAQVAAGSERAVEARLMLIRRRLQLAEGNDSLYQVLTSLQGMSEGSGSFTPTVLHLQEQLGRTIAVGDSVQPGAAEGDLRLFMAGEMGRDSLDAPRFAAAQFHRVVNEWPASPFAPKALLALILLEPGQAEGYQARVRSDYPASPYLLLVDGSDSPGLMALEDSLQHFALTFRTDKLSPTTTPVPGVQPIAPGSRPNRPRNSGLETAQ